MSIDINELNAWMGTDEGKAWADGLKAPLLAKRDELLKALKDANGVLSASAQRATDADKLLADKRAATAKILIEDAVADKLKKAGVFEAVRPTVATLIKESYGLNVKADGLSRKVSGKLKEGDTEREIGLDEAIDHWLHTDEGKANTLETNTGGGAPGSGSGHSSPVPSLSGLSGPELARMPAKDFQAAIEQARTGQ
jgi:hypothetical protein